MKMYVLATFSLAVLSGCNKKEIKTIPTVEKKSNDNSAGTATFENGKIYNYTALNGVNTEVTFKDDGSDNTISIKTEANKFVLDHKDGDEYAQIYERNGVEAKLTKDSLFIMQGEKTIPLALKQ